MISVFTPSHDPKWLDECHASLKRQTYKDWEWIVLLNNGASWSTRDKRVTVLEADPDCTGVGALKARAVKECTGSILIELDHDDVLLPTALADVWSAFQEHPDAGMVYSHCAAIDENGQPVFTPYKDGIGWRYKQARLDGKDYIYPITLPPTPHNVAHIWYAPNHLRAFTHAAYDQAGGYNIGLDVLDDQDLMSRLYQVGEFVLIDKCLYLQRQHSHRTSGGPMNQPQTETNARIQVETLQIYDRTIESMALAWAKREGLLCLDLGGAHGEADSRYLRVDQHKGPGVDLVHRFPGNWFQRLRLRKWAGRVGVIRAQDFLEHVEDKVAMMNEIWRLLAPGGLLLSSTPSTDGRGAFQDPTHVAFWNANSFWYYTDPNLQRFVPEITARFQVSRILDHYPSAWHQLHLIPYVAANLIALKGDQPRNGGGVAW